ncbi:MAG: PAS domain-containing protein [Polyangiaceae bacterium]|nr:PAS domain-containing protein [Polyangiaceae bacterium]MCE7889932.1 HAMP domain-containing protein [Sorangiineae bacterium PRO1]MCL4750814.1 cell wall metabolism sensor histidine kinase WalK [Myxococcales bacterium]
MRLGVRAKLFLLSLGLIIASVIASYAYLRGALEDALLQSVRTDLHVRVKLIARELSDAPADSPEEWQLLAQDLGKRAEARVTLIDLEGKVFGDSDVTWAELPRVENHRGRAEVDAALAGRTGESVRHSTTVRQRMLYMAEPFQRDGKPGGVARVALSLARVDGAVADLRRLALIAALLAIAVAVVLSSAAAQLVWRDARSLTEAARRMAAGDLATRTRRSGTDELGELGRALDALASSLSSTLSELRSERDRVSGILSGMQEGVLLLDRDGRVALVNPALCEMLLLPSDAQGKTPLEVIRHAQLKSLLDDVIESDEPHSRDIEVGGIKPRRLLVRAAPLAGEQGGTLAVFVDVTDMRRLETMRRDFVANVSHELRTPVTAIRSAAETLDTALEKDPEAARRFVEIIDRNAERLRELVEDLLDLSRIESQTYKLGFASLELGSVASHVIDLFRERADKKRIRLLADLPAALPKVCVDPKALDHVLTNLIDNAVKYCPNGSTVSLRASEEGDLVRVSVSDDGPGIEPRHLPRLFERFYRVDAGRSRELGGTGLGLSIVKHLVEAMGGSVRVESTLGSGTQFSFTLRTEMPPERSAPNVTETS